MPIKNISVPSQAAKAQLHYNVFHQKLRRMHIVYMDESGDDGFPKYSSPVFVLSSLYMDDSNWKRNFELIKQFRNYLKQNYNFPIAMEFHTREFIQNKNPYTDLRFSPEIRKKIVFDYAQAISSLECSFINTAIIKPNIQPQQSYNVLENALVYSIQRLQNDMKITKKNSNFMIITDEGRVSKMVTYGRKIRAINYVPSHSGGYYPVSLEGFIEDPIQKESTQSYFLQTVDFMAHVMYLYSCKNICSPPIEWASKSKSVLSEGDELRLLDILKKRLNTAASKKNEYGLVWYPVK